MKQSNPNYQRLVSVLILVVGLIWIWFSADRKGLSIHRELPIPKQGFIAPDFTLRTLKGETIRLSDLRGQPVVVNFWASWCQPCRVEMPAMERAFKFYQAQGLIILAVNASNQDEAAQVQEFVNNLELTFSILMDQQGVAMSLYQVTALPTTFFIRADGVIQEVVIGGPMAEALLTSRMDQLLEGK
jgi:cytochrome c biogenesis protein CcmG, thiol:disulfide interchange protein DsbE